jgi:hypothetical protein
MLMADEPRFMTRVLLVFDKNSKHDSEKLFVVSVPVDSVKMAALPIVRLSANDNVPALIATFPSVLPAVVRVCVTPDPATLTPPRPVTVIPATKVIVGPFVIIEESICKVPVNPVKSRLLQVGLDKHCTVTAPEAASMKTSSADVGTAAPPAPPDVVAHFEAAVVFHTSVPPTQNSEAIR